MIRDRSTEIERPEWWPPRREIKAAMRPEAGVITASRHFVAELAAKEPGR